MRTRRFIWSGLAFSLAVTACGSANKTSGAPAGATSNSTPAAASATTDTPTTASPTTASPMTAAPPTTASASPADVMVANSPTVGALLIGPNGHTLYLFEQDNGTMSACTAGCAPTWPALAASGTPKGGPGIDTTKLSTANGQVAHQVVYNGHLLYYFAGDSAPGQTNGVKIPGWAAVAPSGNKIDKS